MWFLSPTGSCEMHPTQYVAIVIVAAKVTASDCSNDWRRNLEQTVHGPYRYVNARSCTCVGGELECSCIICERCTIRLAGLEAIMGGSGTKRIKTYNPSRLNTRHGPAGDYERLQAVYLASAMVMPWTAFHMPFWHDLLTEGAMNMTENDILAGVTALLEAYPRVAAWITFRPLYLACLARMPRLIACMTELMERRNGWFSPAGEFATYSHDMDAAYEWPSKRLDFPAIARRGPHNIPRYLFEADCSASTINLNHAIQDWVEKLGHSDVALYNILGRALASNVRQWQSMECSSMNGSPVVTTFLACISHCVTGGTVRHGLEEEYCTPMYTETPDKLIWHTRATRCAYCPLASVCPQGATQWHNTSCRQCLPDICVVLPVAATPYECVVATAVTVRRRRLRGVFYCAMVLIGKARVIHYRPGVGAAFRAAMTDFYSMN
jgi:hypothetical protein